MDSRHASGHYWVWIIALWLGMQLVDPSIFHTFSWAAAFSSEEEEGDQGNDQKEDQSADGSSYPDHLATIKALASQGRMVPYIEHAQIVGFRIIRLNPGSFWKKIGLREGDIIHRINAVDLSNPGAPVTGFQDLESAEAITLEITRDGIRQTLSWKASDSPRKEDESQGDSPKSAAEQPTPDPAD